MDKKISVLIVEDSEDDAVLLLRELSRGGYKISYEQVYTSETMEEALDRKEWDLILCDYDLPQFNALGALEVFKKKNIDIPIIIVSGAVGEEIAVETMKAGAHDYITKGNFSRLIPAIERELREVEVRRASKAAEKSRKKTEKDLKNTSLLLEAMFNVMPDIIGIQNDAHEVLCYNEAGYRFLNKTHREVTGKKCYELIGRSTVCENCATAEVYKTKKPAQTEKYIEPLNLWLEARSYPILDENNNVIRVVEHLRDITDRKEAEEELKDREEWFRALVETSKDAMIAVNNKGFITIFNPAAEFMFGYEREEMIGKPVEFLVPEEYRDKHRKYVKNYFLKNLSSGIPLKTLELSARRYDGTEFPVELSLSPGRIRKEKFALAILRDITERKKAEEDRKRLEARLYQSHKLEAIGTLAGGISHDFNNILGAIIGYTELALNEVNGNISQGNYLEQVLMASNRAKKLIKQILTFSRQGEHQKKPLKISVILMETLDLLRGSIPSNIEVHEHFRENSSVIMADGTQIHQVIMNLCTNAIYAMREGGGILEVALDNIDIEPEDASLYTEMEPGPYIKITITDSGDGIDYSIIEKIFDPYFSTKEPGEGTGMGLAVVHGIVQSHGGTVKVYSRLGVGTTFCVFFPEVTLEVPRKPESIVLPVGGNEKILLVDDEEELVFVTKLRLECLGYKVFSFTSGIEALNFFEKDPHKFDIVITDHTMPFMNGIELTGKILKVRSHIPVVLCTGFSDLSIQEEALSAGIREFIMKPLDTDDMARVIREVIGDNRKIS